MCNFIPLCGKILHTFFEGLKNKLKDGVYEIEKMGSKKRVFIYILWSLKITSKYIILAEVYSQGKLRNYQGLLVNGKFLEMTIVENA